MKAKYIFLVLSWFLAFSSKAELDTLLLKKIEKELSLFIDRQVAQNLENDRLGKSHLNNYIIHYQRALDDETNYFKIQEANNGKTFWELDGVFFNDSPDGIKGILNDLNRTRTKPEEKVYVVLVSIYDYKRDILKWHEEKKNNQNASFNNFKPVDKYSEDWALALGELKKQNYKPNATITQWQEDEEMNKIRNQGLDRQFIGAIDKVKIGKSMSPYSISCFSYYTKKQDGTYKVSTNIYRRSTLPDVYKKIFADAIKDINGTGRNKALRDIVKSCSDYIKLNSSQMTQDIGLITALVQPAKENNEENADIVDIPILAKPHIAYYTVGVISLTEGINSKLAILYNQTRKSVYVASKNIEYLVTPQEAQLMADAIFEKSGLGGDDVLLLYLNSKNTALNIPETKVRITKSGDNIKNPTAIQKAFAMEADELGKNVMYVYYELLAQEKVNEVAVKIEEMDYAVWRTEEALNIINIPDINEAIFQDSNLYKELCEKYGITYLDANKIYFYNKPSNFASKLKSTYQMYYEDRYIGNIDVGCDTYLGSNTGLGLYARTQRAKAKYPNLQKVNGKWIEQTIKITVGYDSFDNNSDLLSDFAKTKEFDEIKSKYPFDASWKDVANKETQWRIALMNYFRGNYTGINHLFIAKRVNSNSDDLGNAIDFGNRTSPSLKKVIPKYLLDIASQLTDNKVISKPLSITPKNNQDCKTATCNNFSKKLLPNTCQELTALVSKTGNLSAVQKLCSSIPNETRLKEVAEKLNSFSDNMAKSFLDDVKQTPCNDYNVCYNLSKLTAHQVEGWQIIQEGMESPNLNSTLAKNYDVVLDATACYIYMPNEKTDLISAIKTQKVSIREFLSELSGIAEANEGDNIIFRYNDAGNKYEAFKYYRKKGGCTNVSTSIPINNSPFDLKQFLQGYEDDRKNAQKAYRDNQTRQNKKKIIDASEKAAEAAADEYFKLYKKLYTKLPNNGKQGELDRVYAKYEQGKVIELIVVECKGGISPLGCRKNNQQGTKEYLNDIIENMEKMVRDKSTTQEFKETTSLLRTFFDDEKIEYYVLRQPFDDKGFMELTKISKFQITW